MNVIDKYRKICGDEIVDHLFAKASKLRDKHILLISSTYQGGGVAEMLNSQVLLFNAIGLQVGWRILHGTEDFFAVTKKFHNALQGDKIDLSAWKKKLYYETNQRFAQFTHINHDLVVVHDPQPLPLIEFYPKKQPWIFRCHIDISSPNPTIWSYLKGFIQKYDRIVVSKEEYQKDLPIPSTIIHPAIDPLVTKNINLTEKLMAKYLTRYKINPTKPIISQISRFDKWKDPLGVLKVFELVRKNIDCQLVLLGSLATDDPEGYGIYEKVKKQVGKSPYQSDIHIILVNSDILVNCIQRKSTVVIQKSLKEGFGLVVSEALYKGTPVVASKVGGIPLQVTDNFNGFLLDPEDTKGFAAKTILLLKNKELRARFAKHASEHVKHNFLITRTLVDWLDLFEHHLK
jgi:trehalose synthase